MTKVFTVGRDLDADKAFALHEACFGDCRTWFDRFLQAADGQQYLAALNGEEYIGGMFLLDACFGEYKGKYVYALGVHHECRGKGIAHELLENAKELSRDFTLICPADKGLAATYEKHGFDRYVCGTVPVGAAQGAHINVSAFDVPCTYADIRGGLVLSEPLLTFALAECGAELYTDGKRIAAISDSGVYAVYGWLPDTFVPKKAQLYLKADIDTSGILADLILET